MRDEKPKYHRELLDEVDEFWRNYDWNSHYRITEGRKYAKIKVIKNLESKVQLFKKYLKDKNYKIIGPLTTHKFIILWYRKDEKE